VNPAKLLLRLALGRRLPITRGRVEVAGISGRVTIARDRWGIPYISASDDNDAWFGLGFCHGQDRAFQLEGILRVARGTLAELAGSGAIPIDRFSRRIGFRRAAERQLGVVSSDVAARVAAYALGINAGASVGIRRRPHEFVLLRTRPSRWTPADVLAVLKLQSFYLSSGWDVELARLKILSADGPEAVQAMEPVYPDWLPTTSRPLEAAGPAFDRLQDDLALFSAYQPMGSASNNWALDARRTATGRPILANDPHLSSTLPPHWYLCRIQTPAWSAAGGSFIGGPAITAGHNGFCAWGLTAGCVDSADIFIEEISPDGAGVREGDSFVRCPVHREVIRVREGDSFVEHVLESPRGPIVSPALGEEKLSISLRAVWLDPLPVEGLVGVERARSFAEFREGFRRWPGPSLNMVYADSSGAIGWQLAGQAPVRKKGYGALPLSGADPSAGWEDGLVPFDAMPFGDGTSEGFVVSANARPAPAGSTPFLGEDWLDGYRMTRIAQSLEARRDWDISSTQRLQLDVVSLPWQEMRAAVLAAVAQGSDAEVALDLLRDWDGRVSSDSAAASVFELFISEMTRRTVAAKAPNSAEIALARGFTPLLSVTTFAMRRVSHLVGLLHEQPEGWFVAGWKREMGEALSAAVRTLSQRYGASPAGWRWGSIRPLTLQHPISIRWPLGRIFNLGPMPFAGDTNTISQGGVDPFNPTGNPGALAALRMVIDVGEWDRSRFALPGGQSGNPLSAHYDDQLRLWRAGKGVPIAWSEAAVRRARRDVLALAPA
jgi:penicillin G amidase